MARHVVVMGVSGTGKSTVAAALADRLGWVVADADDFHPRASRDRMTAGTPLTDVERLPWLQDLAAWMAAHRERGVSTVLGCSALRRTYRDVLRAGAPDLYLVHLDGDRETIRARLVARAGHFMPASLLDSQLDTLEPLQRDEKGVVLDLRAPLEQLVDDAAAALAAGWPPSPREPG